MATKPVKEIRLGSVKLCFWQNNTKDNKRFYSVSIGKSYRDEKDLDENGKPKWKETEYFSEYDMADLQAVIMRAMIELVIVKEVK